MIRVKTLLRRLRVSSKDEVSGTLTALEDPRKNRCLILRSDRDCSSHARHCVGWVTGYNKLESVWTTGNVAPPGASAEPTSGRKHPCALDVVPL